MRSVPRLGVGGHLGGVGGEAGRPGVCVAGVEGGDVGRARPVEPFELDLLSVHEDLFLGVDER
jgi:hypothetical protein